MGFLRWLFGIEKKQSPNEEPSETYLYNQPQQQKSMILNQPKDNEVRKPEYKSASRTKESSEYIQTILRKANSSDTQPKPFVDNKSNPSEIERLTNKLKAEYADNKK